MMTPATLAQAAPPPAPVDERWTRMSEMLEHFDSSGALNTWWIALVLVGVLLLIFGLWLGQRRRRGEVHAAPIATFRKVAGALGLPLSDQVLLIRLAHQENLPSPITLLLSPATLAHHASHHAAQLNGRRGRALLDRTEAISQVLFGGTPTSEPI